jgi:hypothetical protein
VHGVRSHVTLPASDVSPVRHATHSNDPSAAAFVSLPQSMHAALLLEPTYGFFLPAAQLLHSSRLVKPVVDEYCPCGHPMQTLLETAPSSVEYNPAGHSVVSNKIDMERMSRRKTEKKINKSVSIPIYSQLQINFNSICKRHQIHPFTKT